MDYERKYLHGATKEEAEHYFPELKEDEKIRKALIDYFKKHYEGSTIGYGVQVKEAIAWLEKQGEKSTIIDIDKMVIEYSQTKDGDFGLPVNCMLRAYRKGINDTLSIALNIEKQGKKEPTEDAKTLDADKVIEWLKNTIKETKEYIGGYGVYCNNTRLTLPYNSIEDLINDFKEDFGL